MPQDDGRMAQEDRERLAEFLHDSHRDYEWEWMVEDLAVQVACKAVDPCDDMECRRCTDLVDAVAESVIEAFGRLEEAGVLAYDPSALGAYVDARRAEHQKES